MKYILLLLTASLLWIAVILSIILLTGNTNYHPIYKPHVVSEKTINYDSPCVVGKRYIIYGHKFDKDNPFEEQPKADVIITDKQNGYVRYCWYYDINKPDRCLFTRSCKQFVESMNPNR
jgi:hypothetical protein